MSYILDALQRSDSERAVGNIQTLDAPNRRPPPARRRKRGAGLGWLILLLLLLALLFAIYFFRGPLVRQVESLGVAVPQVLKTEIPGLRIGHGFAPPKIAAKVQPPAPAAPAKTRAAVSRPAAPETMPAPGKPVANGNRSGVVVDTAPQRAPARRQPVARVNQPVPQNVPQPVPGGLAPAKQPLQPPGPPPAPEGLVASAAPESGGSGVSAVPQGNQRQQVAAQDNGEVQSSDDLPSSMRQQLPQMALNVVSYSRNDEKRFVMIDQKIYREGESVPGGMTIEEITEDGPVMTWRGRRFLMRP